MTSVSHLKGRWFFLLHDQVCYWSSLLNFSVLSLYPSALGLLFHSFYSFYFFTKLLSLLMHCFLIYFSCLLLFSCISLSLCMTTISSYLSDRGRHSLIFSLVCRELLFCFCVPVLLRFFGFCRGIWSSDRLELEVFLIFQ